MRTQLTHSAYPHVLTNVQVFSPDGKWIVYDVRSGAGNAFDGERIERVHVETGETDVLYTSKNGAKVGVVTYNPVRDEVVFICGPEHPTPDFSYGAARRQGLILDVPTRQTRALDARDLVPPFTPGALRGGTHVHVYSPDGRMVSSTYEDHILESCAHDSATERNHRTVAVSQLGAPVEVPGKHPRNHGGVAFTVVVAATTDNPGPGSDQIERACEEGWVGTHGYVRSDGTRQRHALAFQGNVITAENRSLTEVFIVDLPEVLSRAGTHPLQGTPTTRPTPPLGCSQRRLSFTADRKHPGIAGPRHWLRSSPDGSRIAFLMKDDAGIVQLWTVSPNGGPPVQLTHNTVPIASAFTWSPDGHWIAHAMDNQICVTNTENGATSPLTTRATRGCEPSPLACVFSPDQQHVAYLARGEGHTGNVDQIWLARFAPPR